MATANEWVDAYTYRWMIEEWHKVEKTGCRLEAAQLKSADGLIRLAALTAVVAIHMLQLRDLVQGALAGSDTNEASSRQDPAALSAVVPAEWICVVSTLAGSHPDELIPQAFWRTLAQQGGFIGRKGDGFPGWQAIWKGWTQVRFLVQGFKIHQTLSSRSCG